MSGAQPKAAVIAGAICVVAEINPDAAQKRHEQGGWDVNCSQTSARLPIA